MKAKSIKGNSPEEIRLSLQQSMADGFTPTLAIVFMSIKQDREAVCSLLDNVGISIFGSTTSGEFISPEISEGGIAIMLLDLNPSYFKLVFLETGNSSDYEIAKQLGEEGKKAFSNPAFIIVSGWGTEMDGEQIIKGIEDGFGEGATIFGGMAGDDLTLTGPAVFTLGKSSITGLAALIIDEDKVEISGVATCGWKPIGITKTITKSAGNIVYTIDDQPALDLVMKYLGLSLDQQPLNNTVFNLGAYYPLQLEREDAPPVMRTAMLGNAEDRSLVCAGNVPQGAKIRFSLPPDFDVIDAVVAECTEIKEDRDADAVIMFSCVSRYLSFGVMTSEEIERVTNVWNAPLIGFFSYGEYGKSKRGKHEFHNNTCCVVALKEKT
ncbi:MAG: FIST C-terminal domain-containing protein [Bacteroidetes bacterium]|nr:FIST C-terminal domain-containing protein [Bacteroidota bacterium]MCW5895554.1 FIST C-terminal domain-containing protein [Bacteroidota bacterium]